MPRNMTRTFTYDDVVRYLYSETTETENELIIEALSLDDDLMSFYIDSVDLKSQMNKIVKSPSERAISGILKYSEQFEKTAQAFSY